MPSDLGFFSSGSPSNGLKCSALEALNAVQQATMQSMSFCSKTHFTNCFCLLSACHNRTRNGTRKSHFKPCSSQIGPKSWRRAFKLSSKACPAFIPNVLLPALCRWSSRVLYQCDMRSPMFFIFAFQGQNRVEMEGVT